MKFSKTILIILLCCFVINLSMAQKVKVAQGTSISTAAIKQGEAFNFMAGGDAYLIEKHFKDAEMHFYLTCVTPNLGVNFNNYLNIPGGVFGNTYGIDDVFALGDKAYVTVEHLDKKAGMNSLTIRSLGFDGNIATEETPAMNITFEKIMNSGFNHASVSLDKNLLAIVGETPFVKEQPAKFKIAMFDKTLKKTSEAEITMPGENTKNKEMKVLVANDGTVYLIKKTTTNKGEIALTIYQCNTSNVTDVKEYKIEMPAPNNVSSYTYAMNTNNEIIVGGTYYERRTLTVGDPKAMGIFYFTNTGKSTPTFKMSTLDTPAENLKARKIIVNGNTVFLTTEQYKENRETPQPGAPAFEYNYNYEHKNEYVIGMDAAGTKKFQLQLARDLTARNFDTHLYSGYYLCNGKLTVVYNDNTKKYIPNDTYFGMQLPVLVQITNDGLMQAPVVIKDESKLESGFMLFANSGMQVSENTIIMLAGNAREMKPVSFVVE